MLKTEGKARGFLPLPRNQANVNVLKKHVWSLLLNKFTKYSSNLRNIWDYILSLFTGNTWLEAFSHFNQSSGVNHNIRPITDLQTIVAWNEYI